MPGRKNKEEIMKRFVYLNCIFAVCLVSIMGAASVEAQQTYTGTVVSYGSRSYTGVRTGSFTLTLKSLTPDDQAARFLSSLQTGGQDALLDAIRNENIGSFSVDQNLSRTVNAARVTTSGGRQKILVVFERWQMFAEVRGGYRSLDYPFGYLELTIDPATGKGSGQYFAAARIRWKKDKNGNGSHIEIEDYATFPAKLINVRQEGVKP